MHKLRKAAVLVAAISSVGLLGAGAAQADQGGWGSGGENGHRGTSSSFSVLQSTTCRSHDANVDVLGQVGILNGLGGNLLNGEGNAGAQETSLGSSMGCNNSVGK
ncbi:MULTISPECIES: hypothetical protein [Streptomyces]|jgi:hypothetical protein|uniref:Secreted protein n=1 Tax=Streptomyces spinosisporus TaxID=2927582 RepID=A0ABS9XH27_9ACTN|nr:MULTISPECIES: hypothetical protein [Streptomyces]EPD57110.1 hypothetical protein HMPREF1211_06839 [Streptomyces sp. HGB0020]MCI3241374.1 hypothetical protein [Streptomyces spinosisporus]WUB36769.1 hypothetical protein OHN38_18315 [Streptomyces sp. NBC_00588]